MKQISKQVSLNKEEYYETHLSIVNCFLPIKLTQMEIKVLSIFMSLTGDISNDRFGASAKKIVKEKLNITSAGLSNYLKSFKTKSYIREFEGEYRILPLLFPEPDKQEYLFTLNNVDHDITGR